MDTPRRTILHISTRLILGGSQENTVLSCEGQARLGHRVHLAFGPIYGPEGSLLERVRRFGEAEHGPGGLRIGTHELPNLIREVHPLRDHLCYHRELKGLIRRLRPDIVHTHSSKAGVLGRAAAWALRREQQRETGRPLGVVHTIHGPPFHELLSRSKDAVYALAERFAARRCHVIVSVADAMTQQFLARGIGSPDQYVTVRSGMEVERYLADATPAERTGAIRAGLGIRPNEFVVGTVARLAEHKGHDDLIEGLAGELRAHARSPRPWRMLWVGDGWWRDRLVQRLEAAGVRDRVTLAGLVRQDRVADMMRAMDILVHPSYREGLPRTVPQALLSGVPVVAYDVDGTREACVDPPYLAERGLTTAGQAGIGAITDQRTGLLVERGDVQGLARAVRFVFEHPGEARTMAESGREACRTAFSAETMVSRLEDVYDRALRSATADAG